MATAIRTENLTYVYSEGTPFERRAVDNVSFTVETGEFVGIIGHTGSGKSTLVSHLNGLVKPYSGNIIINGRNIWDEPKKIRDVRFEVGMVFQYPEHQLFEETVYKDIAFGPSNMGLTEEEIAERVKTAAIYTGIDPSWMERSPFELSGGQKRRVAVAGVLAMQPNILILDEPAAGLDPIGRNSILKMLSDYHKSTGCTVLMVSHSMEDIARYATKALVMSDGKLFDYGTVGEVFDREERLSDIGLSIPSSTRILKKLKAAGLQIDGMAYTPESVATLIKQALTS